MKPSAGMIIYAAVVLIVAIALAINGYSRDGFWYGAGAVFCVWWFYNIKADRFRTAREKQLIAAYAPELVDKDFVASAAFVLEAINKFKAAATPDAQRELAEDLAKEQADWRVKGQEMPPWATLSLVRRAEARARGEL